MATGLFVRGRDTAFLVYFNGGRWDVKTRTWRVQEQATQATDQVNGEQRARLQKVTDYYDCAFDCYEDGSSQILQNIIINQQNEDAQLPDLVVGGGIKFVYRNAGGAKAAFTLTDCTMPPLNMSSGGRTEAFNHALNFRARFFNQVPAT